MARYTAEEFEKRSLAVYLACEDGPAADLSACLKQAAHRERDWQALKAWASGDVFTTMVPSLHLRYVLAEMSRLDAAEETP